MKSWMWRSSDLRRTAAAVLAATVLSGAAPASAEPRYGRVIIDTTPVAETGAGQLAENIRPVLAAAVNRALSGIADPRDRRAPTVIVTVKSLQLAMFGGAEDRKRGFGGGTATDYLDTAVTVQSGSQVIARFPLLVTQPATAGGPWYVQGQEDKRVEKIGEALGYWLRGKLQG